MKKFAIISALLSTQALAHQVPEFSPELLKAADGDSSKAGELSVFCETAGRDMQQCAEIFSSASKLKIEAAQKCLAWFTKPTWTSKFKSSNTAELTSHMVRGGRWHEEYRTDEYGDTHRHGWNEKTRKEAVKKYEQQLLINAGEAKREIVGSKSKGTEMGINGDTSLSAGIGAEVAIGFGGNASHSDSHQKPVLTKAEVNAIATQAKAAYDNPTLAGLVPDFDCGQHEKNCFGTDGSVFPNESYVPPTNPSNKNEEKKKDKPKEEKKSTETKSQTPKTADEQPTPKEPEIEHKDGGIWADNDRNTPNDELWATSVDPNNNLKSKSLIEDCMERVEGDLLKKDSWKHKDPNILTDEERKALAEDALREGRCDVDYFGFDFCQKWEQEQKKTEAQNAEWIAEQKKQQALENFRNSGICDSIILGADFCDNAEQEGNIIKVNPADALPIGTPGSKKNPREGIDPNGGKNPLHGPKTPNVPKNPLGKPEIGGSQPVGPKPSVPSGPSRPGLPKP